MYCTIQYISGWNVTGYGKNLACRTHHSVPSTSKTTPSSFRVCGLGVYGLFKGANFQLALAACIMGENLRI